jgi:hypothetical protein
MTSQHGAYALRGGLARLHAHVRMRTFIRPSNHMLAPQCYVIRTLPVWLSSVFLFRIVLAVAESSMGMYCKYQKCLLGCPFSLKVEIGMTSEVSGKQLTCCKNGISVRTCLVTSSNRNTHLQMHGDSSKILLSPCLLNLPAGMF